MIILIKKIKIFFIFFSISFLVFFSGFIKLSAEEIDWIEVAKTNNQIQFIDVNSIKYNNKGLLSVITKYSELNPEDQSVINSNTYLIGVDCENRLFSQLPLGGELNKVENWEKPTNNKLIKKTIMNSCSY